MNSSNLFSLYLDHLDNKNSKIVEDAKKNKIVFVDKNNVEEEGIFKFECLKRSGFCTFYTGLSFWNMNSIYFRASRKASMRLSDFIRVYIVKNGSELNNEYLVKQIQLDIEAKTNVFVCDYNLIPNINAKKDFGIWDEEYLCIVHYDANNVVTGATIDANEGAITSAIEWKKEILGVSKKINTINDLDQIKHSIEHNKGTISADRYKEFQLQSIEYQMSVAEKECTHSYLDNDSCMWYHSSWPILRALNVVSTPNWHDDFYLNAISAYLKTIDSKPNILISATADATILEHIESALGDLNNANVWVVDLCPTPLAVTQKYARSRGREIHTLQVDALHLFENGLRDNYFDLVITDAFITRFESEDDKQQLLRSWFKILKPGGRVVTTCRVTGNKKEIGSLDEVMNFVKKTSDAFDAYVKENPTLLRYINKELTLIKSEEYAKHIVSNPISETQIHSLFLKAGFSILNNPKDELLLKKKVGGEFKATTYSQIIAQK
jgi:ubiquinone/menaquinone biosynthesis C-methylase UbiE